MPWLFLPGIVVTMVLLAALGMGFGFMLAVANVYFRDTSHFVAIIVQIWMYATPIVYPISLIQSRADAHPSWHLLTIYRLNPIERFAEVFRAFIYENRLPTLGSALYVIIAPAIVLAVGLAVFQRYSGRLAEEL
jgi:ABC-2 type transport system permease protein